MKSTGLKKQIFLSENFSMKRIIALYVLFIIACSLIACSNREDKFTSPSGENTITIKYDYASRPSVYYKGDCIWEYPGSGFNEEAIFNVEWIDDDTIKLIYNDETHSGKYSEEFEIDW